jgi:hypothetical protein
MLIRLISRTRRSLRGLLLTTEESALLKTITRLSDSEYPITLSLIRDLTKEIRSSRFYLTLTLASYSPISKQ